MKSGGAPAPTAVHVGQVSRCPGCGAWRYGAGRPCSVCTVIAGAKARR